MRTTVAERPKHHRLLLAGWCGVLGWLLAGAAFWVFYEGIATANRPHEISGQWAFFSLAGIDLILAVLVSVLLVRNFRRDGL